MSVIVKKVKGFYRQYQLRKEYRKLRLEALEAIRSGDVKKSVKLDARADKMLDKVIF